jgi:CheY-like chemotaxis protein
VTDQPEGNASLEAIVAQAGSERVLFVDNEPQLADVAARGLSRLGYRVEACTSATHAITIFREDPTRFDLVITDMDMPRVTGLALLGQLRELRADIPTILCTGSRHRVPDDPDVARTIDAIVGKPASIAELSTVMRRVIDASGKDGARR